MPRNREDSDQNAIEVGILPEEMAGIRDVCKHNFRENLDSEKLGEAQFPPQHGQNLISLLKLYNIIAQKESKLNFQMAEEQRILAHASKRDSSRMKTISLLGVLFLPGAYLAVCSLIYDGFC
jgi:hypothetical protein